MDKIIKRFSKLIVVMILIVGLLTLAGCGEVAKDGTCTIGSAQFKLPDGWSNAWKTNEYVSDDNDSYLKVAEDDEITYKKAIKGFWDKTSEAADGSSDYRDLTREDVTVDGHKGQLYTYTLIDDDTYYCAMVIIEQANGIINLAYSSRNQDAEDNQFDDIVNSIKF